MSVEDERAARPRGAPFPPDIPSRSGAARPEDDADARSPRSLERLARAKAEVAAIAARVRGHVPPSADGAALAPSDRRAVAPLERVYDRDRLGSHGTLSRRGDSWWFFDTHPDFVCETLASDASVVRCPHLIGNRPTRAPHAVVTERRANDFPCAKTSLLREPREQTSLFVLREENSSRPSLRRAAHCRECWERLEVRRLRAAVTCHACGDAFPITKTEPFPLLCDPRVAMALARDVSAAATARAAKVVDVCFLCAPDWKAHRAREDATRDHLASSRSRHAASDAASRAFAELPLAARTALVETASRTRRGDRSEPPNAPTTRDVPVPVPVPEDASSFEASFSAVTNASNDAAAVAESLTAELVRDMRAADAARSGAEASRDEARRENSDDGAATNVAESDARGGGRATSPSALEDGWNPNAPEDSAALAAREAAAIVEALRRRGDDVDAAMRDARDARGEETAAAFARRTVGDAGDAAARADERHRARLNEVLRRDGGAYPLVRRSSDASSAEYRVSEKKSVADDDEPEGYATFVIRWDATRRDDARDAVSAGVAAEEETTRVAAVVAQRDLEAEAEARREKREREREKLVKWAKTGVDLAEYAPRGGSSEEGSFARFGGVGGGVEETPRAKKKKDDDDDDDAVANEADPRRATRPSVAASEPSAALSTTTKPKTTNDVAIAGSPSTPAGFGGPDGGPDTPRGSVRLGADSSAPFAVRAERATVRSIAARAANAVETIAAPILASVLARVFETAKEPADVSSEAERARAVEDAKKKPERNHRRRAAPSVDVIAAADSGHALPAHPRAPFDEAGLTAAWMGAAARRRRRRRNVPSCRLSGEDVLLDASRALSSSSVLAHNAPHGRAHEPFDENDAPGVPIPLREALRVAAELPSALSPVGERETDADARTTKARVSRAAEPATVSSSRDAEANAAFGGEDATATLAYARARVRREEKTRLEHAKLRGVALGIGGGSPSDDANVTKAARAAALSHGRVVAPLALLTDATLGNRDDADVEKAPAAVKHREKTGESRTVSVDVVGSAAESAAESTPTGSPGAEENGGFRKNTRRRRLSASTASALVAEAASRAKAAVAEALGRNLAERRARVFGLGLPIECPESGAAPADPADPAVGQSEAEAEAAFLRAARKREKATRARDALRRRGKSLSIDTEDADASSYAGAGALGEGRGVCAMDVATRAPALGAETSRQIERERERDARPKSPSFRERERAYHAETFGRGSEPPKEPSALALAARRGVPARRSTVAAGPGSETREATETTDSLLLHPAKNISPDAVAEAASAPVAEVFVDLEDVASHPADRSTALLASAAAKLRALAEAHRLKLDAARPSPARHLREEASSADSAGVADSDDSDAAYQRLTTPFDSDGVPTPTLADLDDPREGPATPETEPSTESDDAFEEELASFVARANGRGDVAVSDPSAARRSRDGFAATAETDDASPSGIGSTRKTNDDDRPDASASRSASSSLASAHARLLVSTESLDAVETGSSREEKEKDSSPPLASDDDDASARTEDDYESRIARVAAIADRAAETARLETRAALGGVEGAAVLGARETRRATPRTRPENHETETSRPGPFAVAVSFFFPGVPYADVATPHARGRVERFVAREIERAVVAAVAEASIDVSEEDVEVVGMSRGPPPAVAEATAADAAIRAAVAGARREKEDDETDHAESRETASARDAAERRARALAVHCAIRLPREEALFRGAAKPTALRRLKNARAFLGAASRRRALFREPRDDEDARAARRAAARARWERLRCVGVAVTNMSSRPVRGIGLAETAVTGSGPLRDLPSPPPPPPLVDMFGGDEAAAEAFREEKRRRDVRDAQDAVDFPDDDECLAEGADAWTTATARAAAEDANETETFWSRDALDAMFAAPPLAIDQTPPHERQLSRSPLERLAVVADAHARQLAPGANKKARSAAEARRDEARVLDEIRDASEKTDPLCAVRERSRASSANARNAVVLRSTRAKANRAWHDGGVYSRTTVEDDVENVAPEVASRKKENAERTRRLARLAPAPFASGAVDGDAYVNPRVARLAARGQKRDAGTNKPVDAYANPRLERLEAARRRAAGRADGRDGLRL